MIYLAHCRNDSRLSPEEWESLSTGLPPAMGEDMLRFRRWQDRQAALLGKLMLRRVVQAVTGQSHDLTTLAVDDYRRPHLPDLPGLDFNISHTAGVVVCCGSLDGGRVGVDVECHQSVDPDDFRRVFTGREQAWISGAADTERAFFHLWTRKEAVMKADGRGFYLDPRRIEALDDPVRIDGQDYGVQALDLGPGVSAHLAVVHSGPVRMERFVP